MLLCLIPLFVLAQSPVRHSRHFEWFYFSHYLSIPLFVLLCWHANGAWVILGIPLALYGIDRCYRFWCSFYPSQLLDLRLVSSNVLELTISVPPVNRFQCFAGDYVYVCVPSVSKLEWHPFTVTMNYSDSEKSNAESFCVYIRQSGNWTKRLTEIYKDYTQTDKTGRAKIQPLVYIDGPISTANSTILHQTHAILIAQGIGITPYYALISDLAHKKHSRSRLRWLVVLWVLRPNDRSDWVSTEFSRLVRSGVLNHGQLNCIDSSRVCDWTTILQQYKNVKPVVYCCGSSTFIRTIKNSADATNLQCKYDG